LAPDKIIKKETVEAKPENSSRRVERNTSTISNSSIPQTTPKSNSSDKKTSEKDSEKQYALDIDSDEDITGAEVMSWAKI
jgi:hypothetical protein